MRRFSKITTSLAVIVLLATFCFWFTRGISGEVFLVSPEGRSEFAAGAEVQVYRGDDQHSVSSFVMGPLNLKQSVEELDARLRKSLPNVPSDDRVHMMESLL